MESISRLIISDWIMGFTLEDSTTEKVPPLLEIIVGRILSQSKSCDSVQRNLLFVLILVILIENGFVLLDDRNEETEPFKLDLEQVEKWQLTHGTLEVNIVMCGYTNFPAKLIVCPVGSTVLVNVILKELNSETYTVCVPVSRYVVSPEASTIPMIFRDLRHLSITLKNKVISAVKSRILSYHGYASASLIGLPEEVLFNIIKYLPLPDVVKLCKICRRLNYLASREMIWHFLYKRDFGHHSEVDSWKVLYKEKYVEQVDNRQREVHRHAGAMHDYMDYSDLVSYVDNPMWGVIL